VPTRVQLPGDALVIRFAPVTAAKVLEKAERLARVSDGAYLASVFVGLPRDGETDDQRLARVLAATQTDFDPKKNRNVFVCTRADSLLSRNFAFVKDGYEGEIPEHYSVDLGSAPTLEDAQRFLDAFERRRR
jgi:hypothetical protein